LGYIIDVNQRPPEAYHWSGRGGSRYAAILARDADNPDDSFHHALLWQGKANHEYLFVCEVGSDELGQLYIQNCEQIVGISAQWGMEK